MMKKLFVCGMVWGVLLSLAPFLDASEHPARSRPAATSADTNPLDAADRLLTLERRVKTLEREGSAKTSLSGYMDFHFNDFKPGTAELDMHRFVLLVGHEFSEKIRFYSELEIEHAFILGRSGTADAAGDPRGFGGGEVELEQSFLDFHLTPNIALRTGIVLVPVGIQNERHEGPAYFGVERHQVESILIPTTWYEPGIGIFGRIPFVPGLDYKAYVLGSLNARRFTAAGIRGGRTKGFFSNAENPAVAGRLIYSGLADVTGLDWLEDLTLGASGYYGNAGYTFATPTANTVPVTLYDIDLAYRYHALELRGLWTRTHIGNAAQLSQLLGLANNLPVAERLEGYSVEAAMHLLPKSHPWDFAIFGRYEDVNTQKRIPAGYTRADQFDRSFTTAGLSFWPHPDVVAKVDYQWAKNRHPTIIPVDSFNIGLGWWF